MPLDSATLQQAHDAGYSDEEIYDHLAQSDPKFSEAKQNGYALGDVAKHFDAVKPQPSTEDYSKYLEGPGFYKPNVPPVAHNSFVNALEAASETATGFIPKSPADVVPFVAPGEAIARMPQKLGLLIDGIIAGVPTKQAISATLPETQVFTRAAEAPAGSKEQFEGIFAAGAPAALGGLLHFAPKVLSRGRTLSEHLDQVLNPRAAEVPVPEPAPPVEASIPAPIESLPAETPIQETIPNATQEGNQPENIPVQRSGNGEIGTQAIPSSSGGLPAETGQPTPTATTEAGPVTPAPLASVADELGIQVTGVRTNGQLEFTGKTPENGSTFGVPPDATPEELRAKYEEVQKNRTEVTPEQQAQLNQINQDRAARGEPPIESRTQVAPEQPHSPTGIKNEIVDQNRVQMGLPERMKPARATNQEAWDAAMSKIDKNSNAGPELVQDLIAKPRALDPTDTAVLLHEKLTRENNFDNAVEAVNNAKTEADRTQARSALQIARDAFHEIADVSQNQAGRESGLSLQARKMLVNRDFSLARMEAEERAGANGGKPLSESQLADVKAAHETIKGLEERIRGFEAEQQNTELRRYFDQLLKETRKTAKETAKQGGKFTDFLEQKATDARNRIIARRGRLTVTVDPLNVAGLVDEAIIGASHIAKGLGKFSDWSGEMVKDFGERIRPYLADLFDRAKQYHDATYKLFSATGEKTTPEGVVAGIKTVEITQKDVYNLARAHVSAGVEGLDNVMSAVHGDLKDIAPDLTQRDVRDLFSDYGNVRLPSKEADLAALRDYRRQAQLVSALEDAQSGEAPKKTGMQRDKPSDKVRELQQQVVEAMREHGIETTDPEKQLASNLQRYKTSLRNRTVDLQRKIAAGDYERPIRNKTKLDAEAEKLKGAYEREKDKWLTRQAANDAANRTRSQKFWDGFVGVERAMKLSSDVVLAKLSLAAAAREGVLTPAEEAAGGVVSKVLPGLAKRAPREGGFSLDAEIKAKTQMFTRGMQDSWQNLKMQKSDLESLYGKKEYTPQEWYQYFGFLHGALKAPVKRAEFARSMAKRMKWAAEDGQDINNPNVIGEMSQEAYVDANRSIFMQDNVISNVFSGAMRMAEKSKVAPNLGPAVARTGRFLVPIVKVPTNIVGEVATGVHGLATGSVRAGAAYLKGIESLPTEKGDAIMRQLKKGLVGNALLLTGYLGYKSIGGFYHQGDQRAEGDVAAGKLRVGDSDLPSYTQHSTGAMLLNIGATIHRVQGERISKKDSTTKGLGVGALAAGQGLIRELPFVPAVTGIADAIGTQHGFEKYINGLITSTTVPAIVSHAARVVDTPGSFPANILKEPQKRVPRNTAEAVKMGIPVLRGTVPEKSAKPKKSTQLAPLK